MHAGDTWIPLLLEKADVLMALQDWDQAYEYSAQVLRQDASICRAHFVQAMYAMTQHAIEEVVLSRLKLLAETMSEYEAYDCRMLFKMSRELCSVSGCRKVLIEAILPLIERAVELCPQNSQYVAEMASQKSLLNMYKEAALAFSEAASLDETNMRAILGSIYCQIMMKEVDDSAQQLAFFALATNSIDSIPDFLFLNALSARLNSDDLPKHYRLLRQAEDALSPFENHVSYDLSQSCDVLNLMLMIGREYFRHAEFERDLEPTVTTSAVSHGVRLMQLVLRHIPGLVDGYLWIALARITQHKFDLARSAVERAVELNPRCASGHLLRAQIEFACHRYALSSQALDEAIACDFRIRSLTSYRIIKAKLLATDGEFESALQTIGGALPRFHESICIIPFDNDLASCVASSATARASISCSMGNISEACAVLTDASVQLRGSPFEHRVTLASMELSIKRDDSDGCRRLLSTIPPHSLYFIDARKVEARYYLRAKRDRLGYLNCYRDLVALKADAVAYDCIQQRMLIASYLLCATI